MIQKNIIYEVKDKIGWITLNRPKKLNAINDVMLRELDEILNQAEMDLEAKVLVIKGAGNAFSVGQDLTGVGTKEALHERVKNVSVKGLLEAERRRNRRWEYIFNITKPSIAQVHGYCLGAGCYLAMVCDITIASEDATFGDPSVRMGALPTMPLWPWLVGLKKTRELLYSGKYIDAKEAEEIGLINKAVPPYKLEGEVKKLAEGMALLPGDGLAAAKDAINGAMEARGVGSAWRLTNEMALISQQRAIPPEEFNFYETRDKEGLEAAVKARDALS